MIENIKDRYTFVSNNMDETQCIGIRGGRFEGVIYKYGDVSIPNPDKMKDKRDLPLKFHYDIVDNNSLPVEWFNEEFNTLIGDILVDIIDDQIENGNVNIHEP
jgi:adenine-specific DNA methylase